VTTTLEQIATGQLVIPQRLNVLRGHVPNESVVSSNRTCYGHAQTKSLGRLS